MRRGKPGFHLASRSPETRNQAALVSSQPVLETVIHDATTHRHRPTHSIFSQIAKRHRHRVERRELSRRRRRQAKYREIGLDQDAESEDGDSTHTPGTPDSDATEFRDAIEVLDPQAGTVSALSDITRSIVVPTTWTGRPPVVDVGRRDDDEETGSGDSAADIDAHVKRRLRDRHSSLRTTLAVLAGVWTFVKTPLGMLVAVYGILVVFSGAGLVICLAGWVPGDKDKQVEVFSQATNALFTITGVGFIPWRIRDTYLISRICHYRNLSNKLRRRRGLAPLQDEDDLAFEAGLVAHPLTSLKKSDPQGTDGEENPSLLEGASKATALPHLDNDDEHMLDPRQSAMLRQCQRKFGESCTWYRDTETPSHRAFPILIAVGITAATDGNSIFQCLMCGFMWGYATHYKDRPAWATGTFMPLSFVCGIISAVLIWYGGKRSKKTKELVEELEAAYDMDSKTDSDVSGAEQPAD
ncbi:unnamed protein product [Parajaminaea phylloscopi]